jgi:hypothetical protein
VNASMNKTDCPGLKWRKRKDGTCVPVWCAPPAAVKAGLEHELVRAGRSADALPGDMG